VPLPEESSDEEEMDEKSRLRLAEQRLLPSAPPGAAEDGLSLSAPIITNSTAPSAPVESDVLGQDGEDGQRTPTDPLASFQFGELDLDASTAAAPSYRHIPSHGKGGTLPGSMSQPSEDKQELERRRLEMDVSSPGEGVVDQDLAGEGASASVSSSQAQPSAPTIPEENEPEYLHRQEHTLPRYER
jgi:hypothetical protein